MFRSKVSWRYIVAGAVATIAVSMIMALLGIALGFTVIDATSNDPFAGLGISFGIWSIISIIVSLAIGGFVAGYFAGVRGGEHGYMVWATVLVIGSLLGSMAVGSAARSVASAAQTVGSGAVHLVSDVGGGLASVASQAIDGIQDEVDLYVDPDEFRSDVAAVLRDTDVPTLQPEYLQAQMREARSDLRRTVSQIALDSDNYEAAINDFVTRQGARVNAIGADIDRDAAVTALMNNRNMTRPEAEQAVDNALVAYNRAVSKARVAINDARDMVEETRADVAAMIDRARVAADEWANAAARTAVMAAIALIIGGIVATLAGMYGARCGYRRYNEGTTTIYEETIVREPILKDSESVRSM